MYNSLGKYSKTLAQALLLLAVIYVGSHIFHRIQRQRYLTMAEKALTALAIEQEIYFSTNFNYTVELTDLNMTDLGPLLVSLVATSDGWSGVAQHKNLSSEDGCTIYFGTTDVRSLGTSTPRFPGDVACTP